MPNSTEHRISLKFFKIKSFLAFKLSYVVFIMLINVKMPTIVGILTFKSMINFMLSWVEHKKSFITSGTAGVLMQINIPTLLMGSSLIQLSLDFYSLHCLGIQV